MQYAKNFTDALQFMWGEGFLSPGGPEEVAEMVAGIDLAGKRVLDIGSGLGGVDALLVTRHGAAQVVGIDVEPQLVEAARALVAGKGLTERVTFQLVEPGPLPFLDASFDVVFSKDAMVHIADKAALYAEVLRVLKPGGWFTAADWLWAESAAESPVVEAWHYSYAHWVEDGPAVGDGAFSSPGALGFYPWIDATKTTYGVLARVQPNGYWASVLCGRLIRKAFTSGHAILD